MSFPGRGLVCAIFVLIFFGHSPQAFANPFPLPEAKEPLSGMGVNIHFTDAKPGELEMLSRAGFRWVRMDFTWSVTEKAAGVYDFSAYDRLLDNLDRFHIRALLILDYTNRFYDGDKPTYSEEGRAAFARWAVAATTHFKNRGVIWEIWNEPNGAWFWKPAANANDYAKLALTVSQAIHKATPDEIVVGPALSGSTMDFVEVVAKLGVLPYWSAITIHPYVRTGPEDYGPAYDRTRELIKKYAPPGQRLDVMCGESGYTTTWPGVDDETQGKYLARLLLFNVLSDVPLTIWYDWHNDGDDPRDSESNFGIVRYPYHEGAPDVYEPKPAYLAARTYSQQLAGYQFKERVKTEANNDYILSFSADTKTCLVVWTANPSAHDVKISALNGDYDVVSFDDKTQSTLQASDGRLTLSLDGGPHYLKHR